MVFTSYTRQNKGIEIPIGKAKTVLHELHRSAVTRWEL